MRPLALALLLALTTGCLDFSQLDALPGPEACVGEPDPTCAAGQLSLGYDSDWTPVLGASADSRAIAAAGDALTVRSGPLIALYDEQGNATESVDCLIDMRGGIAADATRVLSGLSGAACVWQIGAFECACGDEDSAAALSGVAFLDETRAVFSLPHADDADPALDRLVLFDIDTGDTLAAVDLPAPADERIGGPVFRVTDTTCEATFALPSRYAPTTWLVTFDKTAGAFTTTQRLTRPAEEPDAALAFDTRAGAGAPRLATTRNLPDTLVPAQVGISDVGGGTVLNRPAFASLPGLGSRELVISSAFSADGCHVAFGGRAGLVVRASEVDDEAVVVPSSVERYGTIQQAVPGRDGALWGAGDGAVIYLPPEMAAGIVDPSPLVLRQPQLSGGDAPALLVPIGNGRAVVRSSSNELFVIEATPSELVVLAQSGLLTNGDIGDLVTTPGGPAVATIAANGAVSLLALNDTILGTPTPVGDPDPHAGLSVIDIVVDRTYDADNVMGFWVLLGTEPFDEAALGLRRCALNATVPAVTCDGTPRPLPPMLDIPDAQAAGSPRLAVTKDYVLVASTAALWAGHLSDAETFGAVSAQAIPLPAATNGPLAFGVASMTAMWDTNGDTGGCVMIARADGGGLVAVPINDTIALLGTVQVSNADSFVRTLWPVATDPITSAFGFGAEGAELQVAMLAGTCGAADPMAPPAHPPVRSLHDITALTWVDRDLFALDARGAVWRLP